MKIIKRIACLLICLLPASLFAQTHDTTAVLITEVYYNTPGDDSVNEWIEIANIGAESIDISDYSIGDAETTGDYEGMKRFPPDSVLEAGQVIVVAQTAVSFQQQFGFKPDYEITDTDPAVPDMRGYPLWASGDLALANDGDELLLIHKLTILDTINYGDSDKFFAPAINGVLRGQSIERVPANCDTNTAAGWLPREFPTPGEITLEGDCPVPQNPAETDPLLPIGTIQGDGEYSPYVNQIVEFRGIVTGIQADRNLAGSTYYTLFVQDLPGLEDGDRATSDAIPVFLGWERPFMQIGDQVRVSGLVTEFFGLTEIDSDDLEISIEANEQPLPEPILIDPPADSAVYFEALEGMLVAMPEARVIGPTHVACGFAVTAPSEDPDGGTAGPERIIRRSAADAIGQIVPILNHTDVVCDDFPQVKIGDTITGLSGPLTYHFDQFKIVQQNNEALAVTAVPKPPLPILPTIQPAQITIATVNLENHFDALDDTGTDAEPKPSPADISLRQGKLAYDIGELLACPTLVGVQEVEKKSLLDVLAADLSEICGFHYTVTHLESADIRGIDVALLSDPSRVQIQSASLQQGCTLIETGIRDETAVCPSNQSPLFSRPPLQTHLTIDGSEFTIYVNHFKSKRGGERETAPRRLAQAQHIADLVDAQLETNPDAHIIVLGDFNDYENSPPMQLMMENGRLSNTLQQIPEPERYSYNFSGVSQLIDGILVSPALAKNIAAVTILHVNADYPDSLSQDTSPANLPYKATDHDLPLLILNPPPSPTPATSTPTDQPTSQPTNTPTATGQTANPDTNPLLWLIAGIILGGTAVIGGLAMAHRRQSE